MYQKKKKKRRITNTFLPVCSISNCVYHRIHNIGPDKYKVANKFFSTGISTDALPSSQINMNLGRYMICKHYQKVTV